MVEGVHTRISGAQLWLTADMTRGVSSTGGRAAVPMCAQIACALMSDA